MISFLKSVAGATSNNNTEQDEPEVAQEALENLSLNESSLTAKKKPASAEIVEWQETIYDLIRGIKDPEKPETLEDLDVVREDLVNVAKGPFGAHSWTASVGFVPTIPHCSLATLIGLCLRIKLLRSLPPGLFKIDLYLQPGSHDTDVEITKQINDKERVCAAMENPHLREAVEKCIQDD